ncbi:hypothetical protein [Actinacidiphila reveromycinica]|uniref:hypothetical protein n=1 Tax=Actinacidiphila reveromycinica TaxID=659352 RepID=UPI001F3BD26F|nr:hypothetical protein [Streptomyces sp. SN-593]
MSGNGSSGAPFVVGLSYGGETGCDGIMACVCDHSGDGLSCSGGVLAVQPSDDEGNLVQIGTDGGVFVPTAGASAGLVEGQAVDITGDQASGYTIGARISADPNNAITLGSDGGLYVPGPKYAYGNMNAKTITTDITDNWMVPTIVAQSGGFSIYTADGHTRVALPDSGTWFFQAQFRCNTSAGFTATTGALFYAAISAAGRGFMNAHTYTRTSTITGMHCTTMDDFAGAANPNLSFRVQANSSHKERPSVTGWWSAFLVGPSIA